MNPTWYVSRKGVQLSVSKQLNFYKRDSMYRNTMPTRSSRDSLNAQHDTAKFRAKLREWRKKNPNLSDLEMPGWLVSLKEKADAAAKQNLNTQAVREAMSLFPPER